MHEDLVGVQDIHHEPDRGQQVRQGDERDDETGDDPQPGSLPVDAARVPGDQHRQQREQHDRDHPDGLDPVLGRQRHMQAGGENDRRGDRPPVLTPLGGRCEGNLGPAGRFAPQSHNP